MNHARQFSTFTVSDRLYGIDVTRVQEIAKKMTMTPVPLSPAYVHGLINLRGQICTAIGLRDLFEIQSESPEDFMNVVCRSDGMLMSFLVDRIGDVIEVEDAKFESTPDTLPPKIQRFMSGVYKLDSQILSVIDVDKILETIGISEIKGD